MEAKGPTESSEFLIAGNFSHDLIIQSKEAEPRRALGGSVAYISSLFHQWNLDFRILSKVGSDFSYFDQVVRCPQVIESAKTSVFVSDFTDGIRKGQVQSRCVPLLPEDVRGHSKIAIAAGIVGEILPQTLEKMALQSERLLCDIQALIRTFTDQGKVVHQDLRKTPFWDQIDQITFLKMNEEESQFVDLESLRTQTRVLLTLGPKGFVLLEGASSYSFPGFSVPVVDPTGAGDSFLAGFAYGLSQNWEMDRCARLANFCGSQAVQTLGVPKIQW